LALNDPAAKSAFATTLLTAKTKAEVGRSSSDYVDVHALAKVVGQLGKLVPSSSTSKQHWSK